MKRIFLLIGLCLLMVGQAYAGAILNPGQGLHAGDRIYSNNSRYFAQMQGDGNFVVYTSAGEALWSTNTTGLGADWAVMQGDGNFVLYNSASGRAIWSSNTTYNTPGYAVLTDFGQWIVYKTSVVWSSNTSDGSNPVGANALVFGEGAGFPAGQVYYNGSYALTYQTDGNLVLYGPNGVRWSTATTGKKAQSSFVSLSILWVTNPTLTLYASSRTNLSNVNWRDGYLLFQADGNLVMYIPQKVFVSPSKYAPTSPPPVPPQCYGPIDSCLGLTIPVFKYNW